MKSHIAFIILLLGWINGLSQSFATYETGSPVDTIAEPMGGVCLMGGSTENDEAMRWFLRRANGGDVLVLRASGSDGYNDYLFSDLGIPVNSVVSIVCHSDSASYDPYVLDKIRKAEAIWLAGGNQWNYVSYWRDSPVGQLINEAIEQRNIVIGGTSAGMAVMGGYYFSAENGTVKSEDALADPYDARVAVGRSLFIQNRWLKRVITDTHYDNRGRKGRHVVFMARILKDWGMSPKGIACDERISVCIDPDGHATIYGDYPQTENKAYFIQPGTEQENSHPEQCEPARLLTWNHAGHALRVYAVYGTMDGSKTFDLTDWQTGNGGSWEWWSVVAGKLVVEKEQGTGK